MKIFLLLGLMAGVCHANWSYANTNWAPNYPGCGGNSQSPINITPKELTCGAGPLGRVHARLGGMRMGTATDNGAEVEVETPPGLTLTIGGKVYNVLQFHYHWGLTDNLGSEHTINGKHYPMEMHVVARLNGGKQLAILGFFFQIGAPNIHLDPLIRVMPKLYYYGSETGISINLSAITAPAIHGPFYRYMGSLTTPPCTEGEIWTVYQMPLHLSQAQLNAFRTTMIRGNNFRPTQPLNGRTVYNSAC